MRRLLVGGVAGAVLLTTGIFGARLWTGRGTSPAAETRPAEAATATVTRTDLAVTKTVSGQLGYGTERPVKAGATGQVTWLPKFGRTVNRGQTLFQVDDRPVMLFYGRTPLFRRLDQVGLVGHDVKVVADNLRALGYTIGSQPSVGTLIRQPAGASVDPSAETATPNSASAGDSTSSDDKLESTGAGTTSRSGNGPDNGSGAASGAARKIAVRPGDAVLTATLRAAIRRWQQDTGATPTGTLEPGSIVVQPQQIRVASLTGQLGDPADSPLISVTRTSKVVTVSLKADELEAIRGAKKVTVTLPSGDRAKARIKSISRVVAAGEGQDERPTASVTITVNRPAVIRNLDAAPVQVELTAETRKNVLAVPVGALLALTEGGYAVQTKDQSLLPVTVGLFAKGMVEIEGTGLSEGMTVVTAS